jgi:hypothetical protein
VNHAELLEAAGVDTVKALRNRVAGTLPRSRGRSFIFLGKMLFAEGFFFVMMLF